MTAKSRAVERAVDRADRTGAAPALVPGAPTPAHLGQATAVEQSRAVAEVQGAIVVAQQCPRNVPAAIAEMREVCRRPSLADRAFYRYSRGDGQVTGATIHLARELARCWGNIQYNISEMRRDDAAGQSEMLAWAWDLQTNTRASHSFVVPHKRDTKLGVKLLVDMRDVYENNTNAAARRLREQIYAVLPVWLVDEAKDICHQTLANPGDGKTREQRIADTIAVWSGKGITAEQLADKLGRPVAQWTDPDLAQLRVIWQSIGRGETTLAEEFAPQRVTAAEITAATPSRDVPAEPSTQDSEEWPATPEPGSGGTP